MSHRADMARLEFILKMIDDIELICERQKDVSHALDDVEGFHAVMMCCFQIGEAITKITNPDIVKKLPVNEARGLRNVIGHNYLGVRLIIIEHTVRHDLVRLKRDIASISVAGRKDNQGKKYATQFILRNKNGRIFPAAFRTIFITPVLSYNTGSVSRQGNLDEAPSGAVYL